VLKFRWRIVAILNNITGYCAQNLSRKQFLSTCNSSFLTHHSWNWALLEKPPIVQLLKNFPAFYGPRRFIIVFTRALHWSLPWARSIQSIPSHPISIRSILILSTHLRLGLPSGLYPSSFPTNILYAFRFAPLVLHAPPISSPVTWSFQLYFEKSTSYEAPHYVVFSNLLSLQYTSTGPTTYTSVQC
jgi:hypothetical protein